MHLKPRMKRKMIHKTFAQLNAERAARRARYPKGKNWFKKKFDRDLKAQASSSQAGGPAHKESGFKPSSAIKGTHSKGKILTIQNK